MIHGSPFCAIKLFPLAGSPTITTHIRLSSICTPAPLVLELARVLLIGLIKSPCGARFKFGRYCSPSCVGSGVGSSSVAEGIVDGSLFSTSSQGGRSCKAASLCSRGERTVCPRAVRSVLVLSSKLMQYLVVYGMPVSVGCFNRPRQRWSGVRAISCVVVYAVCYSSPSKYRFRLTDSRCNQWFRLSKNSPMVRSDDAGDGGGVSCSRRGKSKSHVALHDITTP
jgi:hypothetical protein